MKNIREMPHWDNDFFNAWNNSKGEIEYRMIAVAVTIFAGFIVGMLFPGIPLYEVGLMSEGWSIVVGGLIGIMVAHLLSRMGRVYKGHGLPGVSGYPRYDSYDFPARAREYFSLPKEDRALYPANIIDVMRNPNLSESQRESLDRSLRTTYATIHERNAERRRMAAIEVDITSIQEQLADARRNTQIEIDTYREFR